MKKEDLKNKDSILALIGIIFFIVLAIVSRTTIKNKEKPAEEPHPTASSTEKVEEPPIDSKKYILESLNQKNYHFTYTITENNQTEIIDGKANGNKMKFTIFGNQKEEYAKLSDHYLKYVNEKYEIIQEEIRSYFKYVLFNNLEEILQESFYKTEEKTMNYTVDVIDLLERYTEVEYTGFEELKDDTIKILKDDEQIIKIEIDYSNYFSYINKTETNFQVVMEFRDFGNIEELEI